MNNEEHDHMIDALPYLTKNTQLFFDALDPEIESKNILILHIRIQQMEKRIEELEERMNRTQEYLRIGDYRDE